MNKKTIRDVDLEGKRVLLRVDYNVPMVSKIIMDDYRIKQTFPTLEYLCKQNISKLVIVSHLGRPKGKVVEDCTLFPVFEIVRRFLKPFSVDLKFRKPYDERVKDNQHVFIENIRFLPEEEDITSPESDKLRTFLEENADILVIDAFGTLHRESTSITKIYLPAVAGLLVEKELASVQCIFQADQPKSLDLLLLGGKKISDKVKLLENMIPRCKEVFVFGALSFPFLRHFNVEIGDSYNESVDPLFIQKIIDLCKENKTSLKVPVDFVVRNKSDNAISNTENISKDQICIDIGPKTIIEVESAIHRAQNIMWNGTPGIFEQKDAHKGTVAVIEKLMSYFEQKNVLVGGGDTVNSIQRFGDRQKFSHISTGGGALIGVLQGDSLPGLNKIEDK